jgi:class 3 adenylate cyclase/tetratricopeptide (TPR) repeat protein
MRCARCTAILTPAGCGCVGLGPGGARPSASGLERCACCATISPPTAKFCLQCGASYVGLAADHEEMSALQARAHDQPRAGPGIERRHLTVVFYDLVASTSLAHEVDPEDLTDIIAAFHRTATDAMVRFGGFVARYLGDGGVIYFGYPEAHEDDAERAIRASLEALQDIGHLQLAGERRLRARVGIASGLVVVGNVYGDCAPGTLDVAGETPNLAARLQSTAEPDTVRVDAATHRLAGHLFEWADQGKVALKGLPEPMHVWQAVGVRAMHNRFEARRHAQLTPLLDREKERAVLFELWQSARDSAGQVVLVSGEAGIGKSRLAATMLADAGGARYARLRYFCSPYGQGSPLHPCIQQLEHAAGFAANDSPDTKLSKLGVLVGDTPPQEFALIAELLNLPHRLAPKAGALGPLVKRRRTLQALARQLERLAHQMPTLALFEDAQWSDETSRELLSLVVSRIVRLPVLLVVVARPEFHPDWITRSHATSLTLGPLSVEVSTALVHSVADRRPLRPRVVADIVARTDGIPLYLEEVTQAVLETEDRSEAQAGAQHGVSLPLSLQASLLARLDRLGGARQIAEAAAAIGRDFTSGLLQQVLSGVPDVQESIDRLAAAGLVLRRGAAPGAYTFKHALIRDAAYGLMVRDKRRAIHARIAEALEASYPEVAAVQPEVLARHYTEGRVLERAVQYWLRAGQLALRRSAMTEAIEHLRRGLALLAEGPVGAAQGSLPDQERWKLPIELDLTIALGKAQIATQGYAVAGTGTTFAKARELCEKMGDPPQLLAVLHGLWTHALLRAEFSLAQSQAEQLRLKGGAQNDRMWLLMARRFSGVTCYPLAEFAQAREHLERGLELYDPALQATYAALTVDDPRVVMLTYLSWTLMCLGRFSEAKRLSEQAVDEARKLDHAYTLAHALNGAAFVALTIDTPEAALKRLDELQAVLADQGIAYYEAIETVFRGCVLAACGELERSRPLLIDGMRAYRATGSRLYLSGVLRMSAEALLCSGETAEAKRLMEESMAITESSGQRWDEAEAHRVHGRVLQALGDAPGAEAEFQRALSVARSQGARLWELRASLSLARLVTDGAAAARVPLSSVLELFAGEPDVPDLHAARALAGVVAREAV